MTAARPRGRPTVYTPEIADMICVALANGQTLNQVCRENEGFPAPPTVRRWVLDNVDGFSARYRAARDLQCDYFEDDIIDTGRDDGNDVIKREIVNGKQTRVENLSNPAAVQRAKLHCDNLKWMLARLRPEKFGDRITHSGDRDNPIHGLLTVLHKSALPVAALAAPEDEPDA